MANYRKIPNLPGGATGYVVKKAQKAERDFKKGMRPVNPATMDPKLKKLLKSIGVL